jgi:acetyl esterase/lipase
VVAAAALLITLVGVSNVSFGKSVNYMQLAEYLDSEIKILHDYPEVISDITYRTANNFDVKLDLYRPTDEKTPRQTLIFIHGGGWLGGYTKEMFQLFFLPFLRLKWVVVNVDYRPSSISLAPAAVEDCLCAMRWVLRNSKKYNMDTTQIVIMGNSAGGHLALTTGLIPPSTSGLGGPCTPDDLGDQSAIISVKPAAIVNWYGITDVTRLLDGKDRQSYAGMWLGNQPDRIAISRSVSPLTYIHPGAPPIITIHGDRDDTVPYSQAARLHDALEKAGVPNKLITVLGGGHGDFDLRTTTDAYVEIFEFLRKVGVRVRPD